MIFAVYIKYLGKSDQKNPKYYNLLDQIGHGEGVIVSPLWSSP